VPICTKSSIYFWKYTVHQRLKKIKKKKIIVFDTDVTLFVEKRLCPYVYVRLAPEARACVCSFYCTTSATQSIRDQCAVCGGGAFAFFWERESEHLLWHDKSTAAKLGRAGTGRQERAMALLHPLPALLANPVPAALVYHWWLPRCSDLSSTCRMPVDEEARNGTQCTGPEMPQFPRLLTLTWDHRLPQSMLIK
jgi:hypothetical protein